MSKDPAPNSPLLSKVVKFVTNPTTSWTDLDRVTDRKREHTQERSVDQASRLALKQIIERKRRNDFVRNREFDMLRKVLRSQTKKAPEPEPGVAVSTSQRGRVGHDSPHPPPGPSSPSSAPSHVRADTLKKIDQIERQMARSWFRKKEKGGKETDTTITAVLPGEVALAQPALEPAPEAQTVTIDPVEPPVERFWTEPADGQDASGVASPAAAAGAAAPTDVPASVLDRAPILQTPILQAHEFDEAVANAEFAPTQILDTAPAPQPQPRDVAAQPLPEPEHALTAESLDPELEEASIRFANGDIQGAEASLLALLGNDGARSNHVETWLTLFDLYRASGWQAKFDEAAIDFASSFGRSAPQWSTNVNTVRAPLAEAPGKLLAPGQATRMHWVCPASLSAPSVAALDAILARNPSPWRIDWQNLKTIEDAALPPLLDTLKRWGGSKGEYHMRGADRLLAVLVECSPTDIREVDPQWWSARLALLRLMNEMDEFELVALNYCVTYEVSPPSWEDPVARFVPVAAPAPGGAAPAQPQEAAEKQDAPHDADDAHDQAFQPTDFLASHVFETEEGVIKGDLEGVITDDVDKVLQPVNISINRAVHARVVDINCRLLMRMDFGAAGALLNWVTMQQTLKRQVVLRQVNRLVGAFFGVIGIHEVARVVLRKD